MELQRTSNPLVLDPTPLSRVLPCPHPSSWRTILLPSSLQQCLLNHLMSTRTSVPDPNALPTPWSLIPHRCLVYFYAPVHLPVVRNYCLHPFNNDYPTIRYRRGQIQNPVPLLPIIHPRQTRLLPWKHRIYQLPSTYCSSLSTHRS